MKRLLLRVMLVMVALPAVLGLADWTVWRIKVARGGGMSSVPVNRIVVAPLKGGREEYYSDGTTDLECSESLLPLAGGGACWWMERHRTVFVR